MTRLGKVIDTILRSMIACCAGIMLGLVIAPCTVTPPPEDGGTLRFVSDTTVHPPPRPRWMTRPCPEEDSVNCFWNARLVGNGRGHSFYTRRMPGDITGLRCRMYVNHRFAANHDHCWQHNERKAP